MRNPNEIKNLSKLRLEEAKTLCNDDKYDGAFYLAGYSIELMLKAKICERFGVNNLFDDTCNIEWVSKVRNKVKVHDINMLLVFSGLKDKLENDKSNDIILDKTLSKLFHVSGKCIWNEQTRYQLNYQEPSDVQELIRLLGCGNGLLEWIENE
ncbi:MAG: hypothetical protein Q9M50_11460 [Methylococcales bacterium]|nr:hypothetical protein [Methylococcales bacterium]